MSQPWSNSVADLLLPGTAGTKVSGAAPPVEQEILFLFDTRRVQLLRYALSFGLPIHEGEDLIQEVFLALFHHLQKGRSRSNLCGWIFRVTHNLALRRRTVIQSRSVVIGDVQYAPEECLSESFNPEEEALLGERQAHLLAIYKVLPENDRLCLQLRAEGLTYREIARVVGVSLGTVSSTLARSLSRMTQLRGR